MTEAEKLAVIQNMPLILDVGMSEDDPFVQGQICARERICDFLADPAKSAARG